MPTYERILTERSTYTGRNRHRAAWRKAFLKDWRRCEVTAITDPDDDTYNPLPYRWVCACPAFVKSRFLICKHLVQAVHRVPTLFFRQVSRERSFPIWRHPDLRPLSPPALGDFQELAKSSPGVAVDGKGVMVQATAGDHSDDDLFDDDGGGSNASGADENDEWDMDDDETESESNIKGRAKEMTDIALLLRDLADAIDYNAPFADPRALALFTRETKSSVNLVKGIRKKEKSVRSKSASNPATFAPAHSQLLFVRTRPRN